ncbi:MAG: hypothetical protein ACRDL6_00680 [Solirubrobacterales bacterium]
MTSRPVTTRRKSRLGAAVASALLAAVPAAASAGQGADRASGSQSQAAIARAIAAQERNSDQLLARPGVVGTAVGKTARDRVSVEVYTTREGVAGIPARLEGLPVDIEVTGRLAPLHHRAGHGGGGSTASPSPTDRWPRPVPIGISTGNEGECSAGTIGARVRDAAGGVYALSNNHVYALENQAPLGSDVLQPGLYDTRCEASPADVLGQLSDFEPLRFDGSENTIDAAIATTSSANLGTATPAGGYGSPSSATVPAAIDQAVQKYGRTSALTEGTVSGINATVEVSYGSGTARFTDQLFIESQRKAFIKAGDSGSLAVTKAGLNPVGLLFAGNGSGKFAVANEIDAVLARFGVTIDGTGSAGNSADVSVAMTDSPDPATAGQDLTYTIVAANAGPDTATGVKLEDTLPPEVTLVSATSTQGTCEGTSTVTCALGALAGGSSATISVKVTPSAAAAVAGTITNTASVVANEGDSDTSNNGASESTAVGLL